MGKKGGRKGGGGKGGGGGGGGGGGKPRREVASNKPPRKQKKGRRYGHDEEKALEEQIAALGGRILLMAPDGNCLFRTVGNQLHGRSEDHGDIRQRILDFMEANEADFSPFVEDDETWADYVPRMRNEGEWGGQQELVAASRLFQVNIVIHQLNEARLEIPFSATARTLHLSFHGAAHYNSVRALDDLCREGEAAKPFLDLAIAPPPSTPPAASTGNGGKHKDKASTKKDKPKKQCAEKDEEEKNKDEMTEEAPPQDGGAQDHEAAAADDEAATGEVEDGQEEEEANAKKGGQCPCGSGRKWRKCCRKAERQRQRVLETKGGDGNRSTRKKDDEDGDVGVTKKLAAISL